MTQTTPHHLVQFAARYAVSELKTFDAFAALFRAGDLISDAQWPAPGSEDTELGVLMEPEVGHGETEVYAGVQA
jgi:hypothetical protein